MNSFNKIRILSRKSDLAVIQAKEVGNYLLKKYPDLQIEYLTKSTIGDKDLKTPLYKMPESGVFTDDLRENLIQKKCDIIVHSWKDLPLDLGDETTIAGTLPRGDQRDILFVKKNHLSEISRNNTISIFSSSPRRVHNLELFVKNYLPFKINKINFMNIRGNIPTRFKKFIEGNEDAFIVAKAAIDRLLNFKFTGFNDLSKMIKTYIDQCAWTITPLSVNPTSPGQGALACEVRKHDNHSKKLIESINALDDYKCAQKERKVLEKYGGGCHQKIGVSFFNTHFGVMHASKGEIEKGNEFHYWQKENSKTKFKNNIKVKDIFPENLEDYNFFERKYSKNSVKKINRIEKHCLLITRHNSLPKDAKINQNNIIWTSGIRTWEKLSKRGIWVNGTSDGMGEDFKTKISQLANYPWVKLTHNLAPITSIKKQIYSYELIRKPIKQDFKDKKYFYWMSSSAFKYVIEKNPSIIEGFHSCGPGNTYNEIKKMIGAKGNLEVSLSYDSWKNSLIGIK